MACSRCGGNDHNIQTCPSVRRCGQCGGRGHDRRNCPAVPQTRAVPKARPAPPPRAPSPPCDPSSWAQVAKLRSICARENNLLAHLYWPENMGHFDNSRRAHERGDGWRLKATLGHGVRGPEGSHSRPTLNFFVVDDAWVTAYATAAEARGIRHGLLIRRSAIERIAHRPGFEFAEIRVGYPTGYGVTDPAEFWRFDIGNHRFTALDAMRFASVVRLAAPEPDDAQLIDLPAESIVTWW